MPDEDTPQPSAFKDSKGFVHVEVDAPVGNSITQPISDQASTPPSLDPAAASPPLTAVPQQQASAPDAQAIAAQPEVQELSQQIQEAQSKEQSAKHETQDALKEVKHTQEQAKTMQQELEQKSAAAKQRVSQAKQEIQQANQQQQEANSKLKELQKQNDTPLTIAGYKPADLAQALAKPPEPAPPPLNLPSPISEEMQQQIHEEAKKTEQQVKQTQQQIKQADQQIEIAQQYAQKTVKRQAGILQKIAGIIQELASPQSQSDQQPYKIFLILGIGLLVLAVVMLPLASPLIGILIAVSAIVQIGMGTILKRMSQ